MPVAADALLSSLVACEGGESQPGGHHLHLGVYGRLEAGPEGLHVVAVHVGVRNAGHVHQAAAVEAQRRHVLEQGEGVDAVDRGHQSLDTSLQSIDGPGAGSEFPRSQGLRAL